jgi:hypothetical protein
VGSPVSQLRACPSERELERLEEEICEQLGGTVEISPAPAEPTLFARPSVPAEAALLEVVASVPPPWYARHARKLIAAAGAAVLIVTYTAWKVPTDAPRRIQPQPVIPEAPVPATAAPAARPATPAPASRASPRPAPIVSPPSPGVAPPSTGPRAPVVTHTLRESPPAGAAATASASPAAPATVPAAAGTPPAAAPGDCPDAVVALGLCTAQARKGEKK